MTANFSQSHNAADAFRLGLKMLIIDGPRGVGKSTLINALAKADMCMNPVKFREFAALPDLAHVDASIARMDYLTRFLEQIEQTPYMQIPVMDRFHGTEIVMSRLTCRAHEHHFDRLWELDERLSKIAVQVILRCDYDERMTRAAGRSSEGDDDMLIELWGGFTWRSKVKTLVLDTTDCKIAGIVREVQDFWASCWQERNMDTYIPFAVTLG